MLSVTCHYQQLRHSNKGVFCYIQSIKCLYCVVFMIGAVNFLIELILHNQCKKVQRKLVFIACFCAYEDRMKIPSFNVTLLGDGIEWVHIPCRANPEHQYSSWNNTGLHLSVFVDSLTLVQFCVIVVTGVKDSAVLGSSTAVFG